MNSSQQNQRGSRASLSFAPDDEIAAILNPKKSTPASSQEMASDDEVAAILRGEATTPPPTTIKPPVEASKPVAEPKKSWWESVNERLSAPKKIAEQRGRGNVAEENKADAKKAVTIAPDAVPFESLIKDDQKFKTVTDFMETVGKKYDPKISREEFVKDFMEDMRFMEQNDVGTVKLLTKLNNASPKTAGKIANAYLMFSKVPGAWAKGGEGGLLPFVQNIAYTIASPSNLASLGAGAVVKGVAKSAGKSLVQQNLRALATAGITDAVATVGSDAMLQKAEQDAQRKRTDLADETSEEKQARETKPFELDTTRTAINVLLSAAGTAVGAKGLSKAGQVITDSRPTLKQRIDAAPGLMGPPAPANIMAAKKTVIDATNAQIDEEVKKFVNEQGEAVLREMGPVGPLADAKIRNDMTQRTIDVAMKVIELDPAFAPKNNQKISDAITRVFSSIDTGEVSDTVLESAIRQVGLTPQEFASANRVTVKEAAQILQKYKVAGDMMKRLQGIDPAFDAQIKELYKDTATASGVGSSIVEGIRRVERESKAIVVSGVATTVRNMMGSTMGLSVKTATRLFEGTVYSLGQSIETLATGKQAQYTFGQNMAKTLEDSLRPWKYLTDQGLSKDLTELLLQNNPSLQARLLGLGEDDKGVSAVARMVNSLNQWQDGIYRRSAFVESIDRQLSDVGMDIMDLLKEGKMVPKDVIARASDDAMKSTMSYMPKKNAGTANLDQLAESAAGHVVSLVEKIPTGSVWIATFPRFMANAMAFQYRHSPLGFASALGDRAAVKAARETGDNATIALAERQARDHVAQATIGTMALLAAVEYRQNNQDTEWFNLNNDDGTVTDVRAIFPIAPYLGAADVLVKMKRGVNMDARGVMETIVGMKIPSGSTNTFLDQIQRALDSEDVAEEWGVTAGKMVGDFAGRFSQPFVTQQIFDLIDAIRGESTARDPNVLDGKVAGIDNVPKWLEAGAQRVQKNLPVTKEELAPAAPRLGENDDVKREGEFINRIVGARSVFEGSPVSKEAIRLGLKPFEMFGRPTGDKAIDNQIIRDINEVAIPRLEAYLASSDYTSLKSDLQKSKRLKAVMSEAVTDVRPTTITKQPVEKQYKIAYKSMSAEDRKRVNEAYKSKHGKSLEEADDYKAAEGILKELNARIGLNKGGFVKRRT